MDTPTLIPRRDLFGNPERGGAALSPDGARLAYLAPRDGVLNAWMAPVDDLGAARPLTHATERPIPRLQWAPDGRAILYPQDDRGDENHRLYAVDPSSGVVRLLAGGEGVNVAVCATSPRVPGSLLLEVNRRDPRHADLHRLNLDTGALTLVFENPGYAAFTADRALAPRFALRQTPQGGFDVDALTSGAPPRLFARLEAQDALTTRLLGLDDDGRLYLLDSRGRDTAALVALDPVSGTTRVLAESALADVDEVLFDPATGAPDACAVTHLRRSWRAVGGALADDLRLLARRLPGDWRVTGRSLDDRRWLLLAEDAHEPASYWLYERPRRTLTRLFATRPALAAHRLAAMHALEIPARDGLRLVSYLTLPVESDPHGRGRPDRPLPLVLHVHGGPWAREAYGCEPLHQWLADRGYAVLSVNFRGSAGFGKAFLNAGDGEFAGRMQHDLLDAAAWAVQAGIAARERVALFGESYGGYATLVGLTFTPEVFACGVDIVGPSSLLTLVESFPPWAEPVLEATWYRRVGDPRTAEGRRGLLERSPLSRARELRRPLLIAHGARDPRVARSESEAFVEAARPRGVPVTYALFPDEGHGFARPQNWVAFFALAEEFLSRWLGGRCEPAGDDFAHTSLELHAGAEHVPGARAALARRRGAQAEE